MSNYISNFSGDIGKTREVGVTSTSAAFQIPARVSDSQQSYNAVMVQNAGTKTIFLAFGGSGVTSTPPSYSVPSLGDVPILAGAIVVFNVQGTYYALACKAAETSTAYVTFGWGS